MVESVAKCIMELDMECLCRHGHRYEALPVISKLEAIFLSALMESLERLGTSSTCDEMDITAYSFKVSAQCENKSH